VLGICRSTSNSVSDTMADFASLHEEADALGDNFMSQMMSSGTLDATGADTTLASSGGMPGYSSSFLPNGQHHSNGGDNSDDASSVSSQLSSASSSTAPSQNDDDDGSSSSESLEDGNLRGGVAALRSSDESSSDEDDDARPNGQLHPEGGDDDASHDDSMTSASQSSEELLASAVAEVVKPKKTKKSQVSKKNVASTESGKPKPKPKIRLSLKLSSAKAVTTGKAAAAAAKKKNPASPATKKASKARIKNEMMEAEGEVKVRKKPGPKPGTKKRKSEEIQFGDAEAKSAKVKKKPGPKPKALKAGGTGVAGGVPPKKRKISTPKSKTTKDAGTKGGKGVKGKNPNKNKGKKGSGAGNASNDAGPGTALEIMLPPRDSGRQVRAAPMFFYSSKAADDKAAASSASIATKTNGSNPSAQAAALAATTYVPDLKVKLPPFQSPGLIVHPSLGFTASSSNTLSAANLHLEKKIAGEMFRNGLEQSGYMHRISSKEKESKSNKKVKTNDGEAAPVAKELAVDMLHRGSSTIRSIEDLFDRWIPGDEARKLIPKDFYEPVPCMMEDEEHPGVTKKQNLTVIQAFQKALGSYVEENFADEEEGNNDHDHNMMDGHGRDKNKKTLPLHKRLPQLPQDFKDMLPVSLTSPYAEDFTYTAKWANYTSEVAYREQCIIQSQQAAKQRRKKRENVEGQDPSGTANSAKEPAMVAIPPVPRQPKPPSVMDTSGMAYQPVPQEHLMKHLDSHMYEPTTSRYHGLLSSAIADPQYVGPNAPGLLGLIHMMSAVGSSANAAAAAAAALGGSDGAVAGKKRKVPISKKKPGGGGAPSKKGKSETSKSKTVKQNKATVVAKVEQPEIVDAEEGAIPETTAIVVGQTLPAKKKNMKIKIKASSTKVAAAVAVVADVPVKKKKKKPVAIKAELNAF
jgi:hypothetical protein